MIQDPQRLGALCIVGAVTLFSAQDAILKQLSDQYPLHELVLTRALIALVLMTIAVHFEGGLGLLRTRQLPLHIFRATLLVLTNSIFFCAIAAMNLAEAYALFFVAPLLIALLSIIFLGERVGIRRWSAIVVGFLGVVVMMRPGASALQIVSILPLLAAACYACMQLTTRQLGKTERAAVIAFYAQLGFVLFSAAMGLAVGDGRFSPTGNPSLEFLLRAWVWPEAQDIKWFVAIGFLNAAGGYLMSQAYRLGEASFVSLFEYVALPMSIIWSISVFGDWPDVTTYIGILMIGGSGLYVLYRRKVVGNRAEPAA